ncbi:Cupin 1 [Penicillium brevicompactum]|uniref:Cupin 1 n=1 Tax=Penicillium brevicompactum TaxID=5074 RepID=UPI00254177C5|nr:Cupin 1 [Penicillium brevicompactum]KAJ5319515.1 Cupin 1 [Penicillium brevicompactum]
MLTGTTLTSGIAAILALAHSANAAPQAMRRATPELSLTAQLQLADTAVDRYKLLPKDEDFVFDFTKSEAPFANRKNFPALVGSGTSFSMTSLPACSMAYLHLHPRATELFVVNSGRVLSQMVPEVGVVDSEGKQRVIHAELGPGMMTIFPAGSFHTQVNPDCEPANFTAALTSEDFGIGLVAAETFALSDDVIAATFGQSIAGEDIEKVRSAIPGDVVIKVEECLAKCGKKKREA